MSLEINRIYHNYTIRMVIFSAFLFKRYKYDPKIYKSKILTYLIPKIPNISSGFEFDPPPNVSKSEKREISIDSILNEDNDKNILNLVSFRFKTPLKEVNIQIDLGNEEKYEEFING